MVRPPLSQEERARGERLGVLLRQARGPRSMGEVAAASGVPVETLRKIETGRIATPAFFTVAALAEAVGVSLGEIVAYCAAAETAEPPPQFGVTSVDSVPHLDGIAAAGQRQAKLGLAGRRPAPARA
jgi:transcriptional regulator with XRE-family HTH domain